MKYNRDQVLEKLTIIFRKVFRRDSLVLTGELTSANVEHWDSLTHMLMITEVEEVFSIRFSLRELNHLKNVGNLIDHIEKKLSA